MAVRSCFLLKHQECHSIIPFLLISSKEIHRVCLSDYEIKHIYKLYKSKTKSFKAEGIDYYRIGLINFYKGKYILAYNSIKSAIKNNNKDLNFKLNTQIYSSYIRCRRFQSLISFLIKLPI